MYIIWTITRVF